MNIIGLDIGGTGEPGERGAAPVGVDARRKLARLLRAGHGLGNLSLADLAMREPARRLGERQR